MAAAARALDLRRDPAPVRALDGDLDVGLAGAQAGEAADALEARARDDLDADRAALAVAQAERAVAAVDGHDGPLVLAGRRRGGGRADGRHGQGGDRDLGDEVHGERLPRGPPTARERMAKT